MYLVIVAWLYVVLMMAIAEATNTTGTVLGAIVTFVLYGLLPIGLLIYLMRTPARRAARRAGEQAEAEALRSGTPQTGKPRSTAADGARVDPDARSHAAAAAEPTAVAPVRKEP